MKLRTTLLLFFIQWIFHCVYAQNDSQSKVRYAEIIRTNESIQIDAIFDEDIWSTCSALKDFVELEPSPYSEPNGDTEVKIVYDDNAIYIAAYMYDPEPHKIIKPYTIRDESSNSSWFGITLDTYAAGISGVAFILTAAGVQSDMQITPTGDDRTWNAVWSSKVRMVDDGWLAEIKIPYSAIRFPENDVQEWKIQFGRQTRRLREMSFWNPIDPEVNGFINQLGTIAGIENVKPPVRFSLTPFLVGGVNLVDDGENNNSSFYSAGMDLKLGLNEAFTLDMTLVPDFSNTISDQQVLNLSPFEVFFEENRQFFTEGTELFSKGDLFYSRRIGATPINRGNVESLNMDKELILRNPNSNQLINASKISGRNKKGTGIGFFNAIERSTQATLKDSITGEERMIETHPITNYNVLVFDQNLKNNSYVTLINTNVLRKGETYDANVTAGLFLLRDQNQKYQVEGKVGLSQLYFPEDTKLGHTYNIAADKIRGKHQYGVEYTEISDQYDPNDLGFLTRPNLRDFILNYQFNQFEPKGKFTRYNSSVSFQYRRLYKPNVFSDFVITSNAFFLTKKFFAYGVFASLEPIETFDYFEPRTSDLSRFFRFPRNVYVNPFISTDWSRQLAIDVNLEYRKFDLDNQYNIGFSVSPRVRATDNLFIIVNNRYEYRNQSIGYVNKDNLNQTFDEINEETILFGVRNRRIVENSMTANWVFNEKMSLNLRLRHYWDRVEYKHFGALNQKGNLDLITSNLLVEEGQEFNQNFDLINIDLIYTWRFAPGSDLIFTWKNNGLYDTKETQEGYFNALTKVYDQYQSNEIAIKLLYYFDFNYLKNM